MKKYILIIILLLLPYISSIESPAENIETIYYNSFASFNQSYDLIRQWEGNYVNHPFDKGGITYGGITKKYNPNWYDQYVPAHNDDPNKTQIKTGSGNR